MFAKIRTFFKQPFPFENSIARIFLSSITIGLFVSLFLLIFQPFGSGEYILEGRAWILWGYGVVTFIILMANILILPAVFPQIFNETKWNVLKGIYFQFWLIVSIGTANLFYAKFIGKKNLSIMDFPGFLLTALAIGFFPVILSIFSIHSYLFKKYIESTEKINKRIASFENQKSKKDETPPVVIITSETGKDKVEINLNDLLFIKSVDNYVELYKTDNDNIEMLMLRSSLKRIEGNLKEYPNLFKCHRAFLVNVKNISKVTGNSQGYKLNFKGIGYSIPVSRNYSKELLKLVA
jgi:hypothetical protein